MDSAVAAMDAEPVGVWLVTLEGVEAVGGPVLTVLAFVRAETGAAAEAGAVAELAGLGWSQVAALRSGEVVDAAAVPEDFRQAMDEALRFGCGLIVYDEG